MGFPLERISRFSLPLIGNDRVESRWKRIICMNEFPNTGALLLLLAVAVNEGLMRVF